MKMSLQNIVEFQFTANPTYGIQRLRMTPKDSERQKILSWEIILKGAKKEIEYVDHHGNVCVLLTFEKDTKSVSVLAQGDVEINKTKDFGQIELNISQNLLNEVELVADKTEVEIKLDKRIYNVGKDLTVRGGNVADVLGNVPSVSVDLEGNISLRGNENVRILINGKPSGLVGISGPQGLQNLPAESIDKVEVITSPSARYGAEGNAGIINVILRKDNLNGLNGNFVLNAGIPERNSGSININYRTKRLNLSLIHI